MTFEEIKKYRLYCAECKELYHKLKSSTSEEFSVSLLYRIKELSKRIEGIAQYVERINDYKVRRAVKIYCIEPIEEGEKAPDWEDVAFRIGNGCTEMAIRKAVSRYFKKN